MFLFLFQAGGLGGALVPMLLIFGVFYLLLIRPQQKKQRQLQATIAELKAGDKEITTGGAAGTIPAVRKTSFLIGRRERRILGLAERATEGADWEKRKKNTDKGLRKKKNLFK